MPGADPYDELPYRSLPIEWTAPERLALTSLLHGGPRVRLERYRVLELGCGDGANLLPMAYYRPQAEFVGVDSAARAIATGRERQAELALANLELVHGDFFTARPRLTGRFDFIIAHGVFSWIADAMRDEFLSLCERHLAVGGLLYLNYNCQPGWKIRGLVRRFLMQQTTSVAGLGARAERARDLAAKVASALALASEHPYVHLLEREFRFAAEGHLSYIAHEFLAPENHAYWRSEFLALAAKNHLVHVADADFNYASGRISTDLGEKIAAELGNIGVEDTVDLLSYRQLHSPLMTTTNWRFRAPDRGELALLVVASCLAPCDTSPGGVRMFRDPHGVEVEAKEEPIATALTQLAALWPQGLSMGALLGKHDFIDDLLLLHRHNLIELRLVDPGSAAPASNALNCREAGWTGYMTSAYHTMTRASGER